MLKALLSAAALSLGGGMALAATVTVQVDGSDAIYGAGLGGNGVSTAPASIDLAGLLGGYVTVSATGLVSCCSDPANVGPDGSSGGSTNVSPLNGISGIFVDRLLFLAGVFIDSSNPPVSGSHPASAAITGGQRAQASYTPLLNQAFFIGDGLTGTGTGAQQQFIAPTGADTLLLGFVDAFGFAGTPGYYGDNNGFFDVTVDLDPQRLGGASPVPLPAGLPLLLAALGGFGLMRLRRRG